MCREIGNNYSWDELVPYVLMREGEGGVQYLSILIAHLYIHELPTKYRRVKILDPQNTRKKKFWTHKVPTRKKSGLMKYAREEILDPRNSHKKKSWTHDMPTRRNFRPTKKPLEKRLDPRKPTKIDFLPTRRSFRLTNTHEKKIRPKKSRWDNDVWQTKTRDPRNLALHQVLGS